MSRRRSISRRCSEGARHLVGHHDFTTFRDLLCQAKSPLKTLDALELRRAGDEIHIEARARSFLHHQVRNMAGTLKLVGLGRWHPEDVAARARRPRPPRRRPDRTGRGSRPRRGPIRSPEISKALPAT